MLPWSVILFMVIPRSVVTGMIPSGQNSAPEFTSTIYSYVKIFRVQFCGSKGTDEG